MDSAGLSDKNNGSLATRLLELAGERGIRGKVTGAPYGTDAAAIAAAGVPTVVWGPGSIDQAHTCDEYIEVDELQRGAELFYDVACGGLRCD
jgi:acetylornithine deacetylase